MSAPGVDFITYDPRTGEVVLWDAKYRGPGGQFPNEIPQSRIDAWTLEARAAAEAMPDGVLKDQVLDALNNGRVRGEIFRISLPLPCLKIPA